MKYYYFYSYPSTSNVKNRRCVDSKILYAKSDTFF